ncbi:hypothetical protein Tco_0539124, partial [Tanacetum coccineum]
GEHCEVGDACATVAVGEHCEVGDACATVAAGELSSF